MIIGITGTLGAGKGTIAEYLVQRHGFIHISARHIWIEEVERRGLPVNRDTITETANDLRAQHGADYFARSGLAKAEGISGNVVLESVRTPGEARYLQSNGAHLWAVDADIASRYERISKRGSSTDGISFKKFVADEEREMTSKDPNKQNLRAVRDMADHIFTNDGTQEELYAQVEEVLKSL